MIAPVNDFDDLFLSCRLVQLGAVTLVMGNISPWHWSGQTQEEDLMIDFRFNLTSLKNI